MKFYGWSIPRNSSKKILKRKVLDHKMNLLYNKRFLFINTVF